MEQKKLIKNAESLNKSQYICLALIFIFAVITVSWGISNGIPSSERVKIETGGADIIAHNKKEIKSFLAKDVYVRSELIVDDSTDRSKFSSFTDILRSYHSDEQFTLKTLMYMVKNRTIQPNIFIYGQFYHYQIGAAFATYALLTGMPNNVSIMWAMENPDKIGDIYLAGRIYCAVLAILGLGVLFLTTRNLTGNNWLAITATTILSVIPYYSITSKVVKPEISSCFWSLLIVYFAVELYRDGKLRNYLLSGIMLGLAVGNKYTAIFHVFIIVCYFIARNFSSEKPYYKKQTFKEFKYLCLAGVCSIVAFTLVGFSWLTQFKVFSSDVLGMSGLAVKTNKFLSILNYLASFTIDGMFYHIGLLIIPLFVIAFFYVIIGRKIVFWPLVPTIVCSFILAGVAGVCSSDRYILLALPLLSIIGAYTIFQIKIKKLRYITLILVIISGIWYSLAMCKVASERNIRLIASEYCIDKIEAGSSIGRKAYPVSYRTIMLPYGQYKEYDWLNSPDKIEQCDYYIDCSYVYDQQARSPLLRRLDWLFGREQLLPYINNFPYSDKVFFENRPWTLARLIPRPRLFTLDSFIEATCPEIILYQQKK